MSNISKMRKTILNQPGYWVEGINAVLYETLINYMEANNLNRRQLAKHLGISKGRVSQILNKGDINFSIEKLIEIGLKLDKFPDFKLRDKEEFYAKEDRKRTVFEQQLDVGHFYLYAPRKSKVKAEVVTLQQDTKTELRMTY